MAYGGTTITLQFIAYENENTKFFNGNHFHSLIR